MRRPHLIVIASVLAVLIAAPAYTHNETQEAGEASETDQLSTKELEERAKERELDGDYPLHDQPREIDGELDCPEIELVEYEGEVIDYNRPIEVNEDFRERLIRFEKIVEEVAEEVYGRAPERVVHSGGHTCKSVGERGEKLSEHAFGHAIDVAGFDFEAAEDEATGDESKDEADEAFQVRLKEHWGASEGLAAKHSEFLRRLADELKERGPFSTMLGPAYKGHDTFFHFDFGPQFFFRV